MVCPYCGTNLPKSLKDGLASCSNCSQTFDSSKKNQFLSAFWLIQKHNITDLDWFQSQSKLPENEAKFVFEHVVEQKFNYDEFLCLINAESPEKSAE